uniref:Membrane protein n=1 Tax=Pithovirus LCPAC403 TaxID=2506596 RepID=A0A481ZDF6_9VIRU|nr:MAG: membrane protein [Pithovirus LCPAC403]
MSVSTQERIPIKTLSYGEKDEESTEITHMYGCNKAIIGLVLFIIVIAIAWFCFLAAKPTFILQRDARGNVTSTVDFGKLLLFSILTGLIVVIIIYGLWHAFRGDKEGW